MQVRRPRKGVAIDFEFGCESSANCFAFQNFLFLIFAAFLMPRSSLDLRTNPKLCHLDENRPHQVRLDGVPATFDCYFMPYCKCSRYAHLMRTVLVKMTKLEHSG